MDIAVTLGSITKSSLHFISNQSWLQNKLLHNEYRETIMTGLLDQELKQYQVSIIPMNYSILSYKKKKTTDFSTQRENIAGVTYRTESLP